MYSLLYHVSCWGSSVITAILYWHLWGYAEAGNTTRVVLFWLASLYFWVYLARGPVLMHTDNFMLQVLSKLCQLGLALTSATLAKAFLRLRCRGDIENDAIAIGTVHILLAFTVFSVTGCMLYNVGSRLPT